MRFAFIAAEKAQHRVTTLCRCLRVTRSGFYAWQDRPLSPRVQRDIRLRVQIRASHARSRGSYDSPRIWKDLVEAGEAISRKRVIRLMQAEGLRGQARRRFIATTNTAHDDPVAANHLARAFAAPGPNQRWVSDTTQFAIANVMSAQSRRLLRKSSGNHPVPNRMLMLTPASRLQFSEEFLLVEVMSGARKPRVPIKLFRMNSFENRRNSLNRLAP